MKTRNIFWNRITIKATLISAFIAILVCIINVVSNFLISNNQSKLVRAQLYRDSLVNAKQMELLQMQLNIDLMSYHLDSTINFEELTISKKQDNLLSLQTYFKKVESFSRLKFTMMRIDEKIDEYFEVSQETIKNNPTFFTPLKLEEKRVLKFVSLLQKDTILQNKWAKDLLALFESELTNEYLIGNKAAYKAWNQEINNIKLIIFFSDRVIKKDYSMPYKFDELFKRVFDAKFPITKELFNNDLRKTI